jgi:hypothetical protein
MNGLRKTLPSASSKKITHSDGGKELHGDFVIVGGGDHHVLQAEGGGRAGVATVEAGDQAAEGVVGRVTLVAGIGLDAAHFLISRGRRGCRG